MHPSMDQLRHLPIADKLRVVEELWDDIEATGDRFPLPAWHRDVADARAAELEANPAIAITREEVWRRVESSNV
ncbi:MAG: addiction module protein [Pirellulaceae bacterium]